MKTIVLIIDGRFFYKFGKKERLQTAWSLAGGRLFLDFEFSHELQEVEKRLQAKGVKYSKAVVGIEEVLP